MSICTEISSPYTGYVIKVSQSELRMFARLGLIHCNGQTIIDGAARWPKLAEIYPWLVTGKNLNVPLLNRYMIIPDDVDTNIPSIRKKINNRGAQQLFAQNRLVNINDCGENKIVEAVPPGQYLLLDLFNKLAKLSHYHDYDDINVFNYTKKFDSGVGELVQINVSDVDTDSTIEENDVIIDLNNNVGTVKDVKNDLVYVYILSSAPITVYETETTYFLNHLVILNKQIAMTTKTFTSSAAVNVNDAFEADITAGNLIIVIDNLSSIDYSTISSKPTINSVELNGDLTAVDLGLVTSAQLGDINGSNLLIEENGTETIKAYIDRLISEINP